MSGKIAFSVILPVCHGGRFLENALDSLTGLAFPRKGFEVLLAGPENDDELQKIIAAKSTGTDGVIQYIGVARANRSAKLNGAISRAGGAVLVFTDDDCVFPADWLDKLAAVFAHETDIGVVGGLDRTGSREPGFNIALDYILNSFLGTGGLRRQGAGVGTYYPKLWNMAIPREVALGLALPHKDGLLQIFDESLDVHEDVELIRRIEKTGKRIVFAPEVTVTHARDTTLPTFTRRSFNMARTSRSIGVHRLPHLLLAVFALGMITLAVAALLSPSMLPVFSAVTLAYAAVLLVSAVGGYMRSRRLSAALYVPVLLLAQHFSRGLGYLFPWQKRK